MARLRRSAALLVLYLMLAACGERTVAPCATTPTSSKDVNVHLLEGKRGGDVFFFIGGIHPLRTEAAGGPEKMLVFLDRIPESPPATIEVQGRNLTTGSERSFAAQRHASEYGTEWGSNFGFPDAGCWELSVDESGNEGRVTLEVR